MKSKLPASNMSPCACGAESGSKITGIPDKLQRPVRKEISIRSIDPGKKAINAGYKIVRHS